jgi:hypothetical protein
VAKTNVLVRPAKRRDLTVNRIGQTPITTYSWMGAAFVIAVGLATIVLAIFGVGDRGTVVALRVTARWSFLLFWLAYVGGATAKLLHFGGLAHRGRELGLAFASAQVVHVGLVLWLFHIATGPTGSMLFFWIGVLFTYLLALSSLPWLRDALELRFWRAFRLFAVEYIALVFADDFILAPLQATGFRSYPVSYLPFAVMVVGGAGLCLATFLRHGFALKITPPNVEEQSQLTKQESHI